MGSKFDYGHLPVGLRRYVLDLTDMIRIAHSQRISRAPIGGIQRILLQLAQYAHCARPETVKFGYFDTVHRRYCELPDYELILDYVRLLTYLRDTVGYTKPIKDWKYATRSPSFLYHNIKRTAFRCAHLLSEFVAPAKKHRANALKFAPGDTLVCLGASWDSMDLLRYLEEEDLVGPGMIDLAVLVHDMIPVLIRVKGVVAPPHFERWLQQACRLNTKALVTTNSTASDLRDWCLAHHHSHIKIGKFPLGDEVAQLNGADVREEIRSLAKQRYILAVGRVTGRKNGGNLIRAWRAVSERFPAEELPLLVIAGREGHDSIAACGLIDTAVPANTVVFVPSPNDMELQHLYANCMFSVFASRYEGWGLPVGESLWCGRICATSNRSSLPEVGGNDCEYFNPDDPRDIARVLRRLISDPDYLAERTRRIDRARLRTWRQAAEEMLTALDEFAEIGGRYVPSVPVRGSDNWSESASP